MTKADRIGALMEQYSFRELLDTCLDWKGNKGDVPTGLTCDIAMYWEVCSAAAQA